jgi:hypothetical protein
MSVLEPLKEKVQATDNLIDKIVYRLYGLTEEEIVGGRNRKQLSRCDKLVYGKNNTLFQE